MDFLNNLKPNSLIISPDIVKKKILLYLSENHIFTNVKVLSLSDLKEIFFFSYDDNAVYYISKHYTLKMDSVRTILKYLYYIDDSENEQMNLLRKMKNDLEKNNFLKKREMDFSKFSQVFLFGYDAFSKLEQVILERLQKEVPITRIQKTKFDEANMYAAKNKEEEITFVLEKIASLLKDGIDLNNIVLTNVTEKDKEVLLHLAPHYHIPLSILKHSFFATEEYQHIKKEIIEEKEETSSKEKDFLIQKINHLSNLSKEELPFLLDEYAKTIKIDEIYENTLRIEPLCDNYFQEKEHVFILSANMNTLPIVFKDDDFLDDQIKPSFLEKTSEKNSLEKVRTENALQSICHKYITLSKEEGEVKLLASPLLKKECIQDIPFMISTSSNFTNQLHLVTFLDTKRKYHEIHEALPSLEKHYSLGYYRYTNAWTSFSNIPYPDKLTLSYSSLNEFYECKFKFYLNHILKIHPFEEHFSAYLGTYVHDILSHSYEPTFDLEKDTQTFLEKNNYVFTKKEEFFFQKTKTRLHEVLSFLEEFEEHTFFKQKEFEKKFYFQTGNKIAITFMGIIDKILTYQDKIAVVDYKTGHPKLSLKHMQYGLDLQLPIYLLFLKKEYPEKDIVGFFLQHVLEGPFHFEEKKTFKEQLQASLKLVGYTTDDEQKVESLDNTYKKSRFIQGMSLTKNGFSAYSKVLSKEHMQEIVELASSKVEEMVKCIENWEFTIDPKIEATKKISCEYCPYRSICYRKNSDFIDLE